MKVLITGSAGFIAPHLIEACLNHGWTVLGIDILDCGFKHPRFFFRQKDVRELTLEDLKGIDYIFHLAFVTNIPNSIRNPIDTTYDNVDMSIYLLDLAAKAGVKKFLFASTASLYGNNPIPWHEDLPPQPIEPYSWQKLAIEYACKMWSRCYGLPTVNFRFFQVFGENQRKDTALAAFLRAKKEGRPITLTETTAQSSFRTGQRDFIYVKELAEACVLAAKCDKVWNGEIINIGSGKLTSMEDIAKTIGREIAWIPKRGFEVERHQADISRANQWLNWYPRVDILQWLKDFVKTL